MQSVCDLLHSTTAGFQSLRPTPPPPTPTPSTTSFLCVLIVPTVGPTGGWGWRMEAGEGASPLCATGVYTSAADVERVKREREARLGNCSASFQPSPLRPPSLPLTRSSLGWAFHCARHSQNFSLLGLWKVSLLGAPHSLVTGNFFKRQHVSTLSKNFGAV